MTKEEKAAYKHQWYLQHREEIIKRAADWRKDNPERCKETKHRYYVENKDQWRENVKRWRKENPEAHKASCARDNRNNKYNFTTDWEHVEGYDRLKAVGRDEYSMGHEWHCHHRFEEMGLSVSDLKEMGLYYNRPACELIIMTSSEHKTLHNKLRNNAR